MASRDDFKGRGWKVFKARDGSSRRAVVDDGVRDRFCHCHTVAGISRVFASMWQCICATETPDGYWRELWDPENDR